MSAWGPYAAGNPFHKAVGRELVGIAVSEDDRAVRVTLSDGQFFVDTDADCCSESWWADITGVESCLGRVVNDVTALDLPHPDDGRSRQESDVAYGYEMRTDGGVVTLVFRNSSNGYYGGSAFPVEEPPAHSWVEITTNDWRA